MKFVVAVLIGVSAMLGLGFVVSYGRPWRSDRPFTAWVQSGLGWTALALDVVLFLAMFHIIVPIWIVVLVLLGQDTVYAARLLVLSRARRVQREEN